MLLRSSLARAAIGGASLLLGLTAPAQVGWQPSWAASIPSGVGLSNGIADFVVDANGVSYVTGITGPSSNNDILTAAFSPGGELLWSHVYNGPANWHDQARGLTLGPAGELYVTGNTPTPSLRAQVLLLKYDAATGELLRDTMFSSDPFNSEHGASVATDDFGNVYVGGATNGDGPDGLMLKFDANGKLQWSKTWDGPAASPFSQDQILQVAIDPVGHPVALIYGVMASLQPDYVVIEYAPADGATLWQTNWGSSAADYPEEMELDEAGDVYVSGLGLNGTSQYATIKLDGDNGNLLWQAFDGKGFHQSVRALSLDGQGGVYIAGSIDPDGDRSNINDDFFTVKRSANDGSLQWTHSYGANCVGCLDTPSDVVFDPAGHVFLAGGTSSPPYNGDVIVFVLDPDTGVETRRDVQGPGTSGRAVGVGFTRIGAMRNLLIGGQIRNPNTNATSMTVFAYPALAGVTVEGQGCTGSGATPLTASGVGLPQVPNAGFAVQLSGGPTTSGDWIVVASGLAPTPIPLGAPGCSIQFDVTSVAIVLPAPGRSLALPIPSDIGLIGLTIAAQGIGVDAITGRIVTSNALSIWLGV